MIKPEQYGSMIEINVTDNCTLRCSQCNRCCDVALADNHMPVADIEKLCAEIDHVKRICIAGGEPMMHPEIEKIISIISNSGVTDSVHLLTNGTVDPSFFSSLIKTYNIEGINSGKDTTPPEHTLLMTVAPIDVNLFGIKPVESCDILMRCGLGYSTMGYYPCCLSAAIGRVFNIPGVADWNDFTQERYMDLLDKTCRYCGYYLTSKRDTILPEFQYPKQMMTVSWREAVDKYNKEESKWTQ